MIKFLGSKVALVCNKATTLFVALLLVASSGIQLITTMPAVAASEVFTGGSNVTGEVSSATPISDLQIGGTGNDVVSVRLYVPSGTLSMTTTTGLTFTGSSSGSTLYFTGTRTNLNNALATLRHTTTIVGSITLEASLVGPGEVYYPANGHIYQVISGTCDFGNEPTCIDWQDASVAAAAASYQTFDGYLATMTSAEENAFVASRLSGGAAWIGASDVGEEGNWKWVTGPETNTQFWSGDGGGSPVSSRYSNWNSGEPNDVGGEDCGQMYAGDSAGQWNDLPCTGFPLGSYIIEYGEDGQTPTIATEELTITTGFQTGPDVTIGSCEELLQIDNDLDNIYNQYYLAHDIDCSEIPNFMPIGMGDVWDGDPFQGLFDGQGHTISGINVNFNGGGGLFGNLENATIRNLNLRNGTIESDNYAGSVAAYSEDSILTNISSDFTVTGGQETGGLVGYGQSFQNNNPRDDITFSGLVYTGTATGVNSTGGIFGLYEFDANNDIILQESYSAGVVQSTPDRAGGLIGRLFISQDSDGPDANFTISNCYSQSSVTADNDMAGGLVGYVSIDNDGADLDISFTIDRSYSSGSVYAGNEGVGGLIGGNRSLNDTGEQISITNSFVAGSVDSPNRALALIGGDQSVSGGELTLSNNYFDETETGAEDAVDTVVTDTVAVNTDGLDGDYFINNITNEPLDTWNWSTIWISHLNGFPTFRAYTDDTDYNGDNIIDVDQPNVGGYVNVNTGKIVALDVGANCELTVDDMVQESALDVQDPGYEYANGLFDFEAECSPGATTTIKLYFYDVRKEGLVVRKYNPNTNAYFNLSGAFGATLEEVTIDGHIVTVASYQITDGGILDMDQEPGMIADPAGLASTLGGVGVPVTGFASNDEATN